MDELPTETQVLETVRQRINAVTRSLEGYYRNVFLLQQENVEATGLPSWNSINHTYTSLQTQLQALQDFIHDKDLHDDRAGRHDPKKFLVRTAEGDRKKFLEQAHVFPTSSFPFAFASPDHALGPLLRKRIDPPVMAWIESETRAGKDFEEKGIVVDGEKLAIEDFVGLWNDAAIMGQEALVKVFYAGAGEDEEDEEDEDEDEVMEDEDEDGEANGVGSTVGDKAKGAAAMKQMPLDHVLSYMAQGYVP